MMSMRSIEMRRQSPVVSRGHAYPLIRAFDAYAMRRHASRGSLLA